MDMTFPRKLRGVVTDLDDTLFTWLDQWSHSFSYQLEEIYKITRPAGIADETILSEIKEIHTKAQTSEFSFLVDELPSLKKALQDKAPREELFSVLERAKEIRLEHLRLYPGVKETLHSLRTNGVKIIGYTESQPYFTVERMKFLGLDGMLDALYSREDHYRPSDLELRKVRSRSDHEYDLSYTRHRRLDVSSRKPAPEILKDILDRENLSENEVIYIGDSSDRDIAMANSAAVFSILTKAKGEATRGANYDLLKKVTHWTDEEVQREALTQGQPDLIIDDFRDILCRINWRYDQGTSEHLIRLWEKTVDVQMHFNDIQLRLRSIYISLLVGLIAGAGAIIAIVESPYVGVLGFELNFLVLGAFGGVVATALFSVMDLDWYHRFLIGAVSTGLRIEKELDGHGLDPGLTTSIGEQSRNQDSSRTLRVLATMARVGRLKNEDNPDQKFYDSKARLKTFYRSMLALFFLLMLFGFSLTRCSPEANAQTADLSTVANVPITSHPSSGPR